MANWDDNNKWNSCETSRRRDYVYRPNSSTATLRPLTSKAFRNSYALTGPVGATAYSEDYCWKPPSKPACIPTGTSSGNRRNNPHPSQAFMVLKLPPGVKFCENTPSEVEVRNAVSAQYKSTYMTDFLGIPQGIMKNHTGLAPLKYGHDVLQCTHTEMRYNYRKHVQKAELQGNTLRYGCNALHGVAPKGIVPTVVQKHIGNQDSKKHITTYDQYFGGKSSDLSSVFRSLQPQELHTFCKHLSEKDKMTVDTYLQRAPNLSAQRKNLKDPVRFSPASPVIERMSTWPGPL